ncbi:hypothetical protein [Paraburkholderia antibiotica]|uniref:Uncharacterized protein n=1 Tax=Paraburkholderia antibiotica TaxID=2728839 RepID=A0A7Y0A320_9BURK|nr:hypothetical protein [Paraburkholderia antibiotica]NML35504.1 hypothetical protein [Paraburkholderia antibiotica]
MADANHKARLSRAERSRRITVTLRDTPDGYSLDTPPRPQQPFMPWEHIDRWLGAGNLFSTGQRVNVSVDYIRQYFTVTPEYDYAAIKREREAFAIGRKADNDELRKIWRAQGR